jgi:hypothetical protein
MIGVALLGTGLLATLVLGVLRNLLLPWCPGCDGRGAQALTHRLVRSCDVCHGTGLLRVPDTAPADWFPQA